MDIIYNGQKYTLHPFNLNLALSGSVLMSVTPFSNNGFLCTEFGPSLDGKWPYKFKGKVSGETVLFDENGVSPGAAVTLYCASAQISDVGSTKGSVIEEIDPVTGDITSYQFSSLNYRENIALQVLSSLINSVTDPLSCDDAKIKLLIQKSFAFSYEFMNQAIELRKGVDGEIQEAAADPTDAINAVASKLNEIKTQLTDIKSALNSDSAGNVVAAINNLAPPPEAN